MRVLLNLIGPLISTWFAFVILASPAMASKALLDNRFIVVLEPSGQSMKSYLNSDARLAVANQQAAFIKDVNQLLPSMKVHRQFDTLINAIDVTLNEDNFRRMSALPQVKQVYPVKLRYAHLDASHDVIISAGAWELLGGQSESGKGINIAIIDSGIRPENPMFSDDGFDASDFNENQWLVDNPDYCRAEDGDQNFCNNKVVVARFFPPSDDLSIDETDLTPLDSNGHGSHVAGIAAGNPVNVEFEGVNVTLSGVAPGARLMIYRALYPSFGSPLVGTDSMLLAALEHAVRDGADVINNSWGSIQAGSPEDSVFAEVFKRAEDEGIVIVSSAGNNGNIPVSINCPGCIESGITVANSTHGRIFGHKLVVDGVEYAATSGGTSISFDDKSLLLKGFSQLNSAAQNGCVALEPGMLTGSATLIKLTNECSIETIVQNASQGGAEALLVYQKILSDFDVIRPFDQFSGEFQIPVLGLYPTDALAFEEKILQQAPQILIHGSRQALISHTTHNLLNPESSTGPNSDPNVLKPDITAPGTDILSASAPITDFPFPIPSPSNQHTTTSQEPAFSLKSGTSMAAPIVAGAAALIRQAHPTWDPNFIKSALMSTTTPNMRTVDGQATPFQTGAGLLDLPAALKSTLIFEHNAYAHGACIGTCMFSNVLLNMDGSATNIDVNVLLEHPDVSYSLNQKAIELSPAGTVNSTFNLELMIDTANAPIATWIFGSLQLSIDGSVRHRLPIAVFANDNSETGILSSNISLNSGGTLQATTRVRNLNFTRAPSLKVTVPEYASIIESSVQANVTNGDTQQLGISDAGNLRWKGSLNPGSMSLEPSQRWTVGSLKTRGVQPILCQNGCSSFSTKVDFPFIFHGENYSSITVSNKGFAVAGSMDLQPFEDAQPLTLPSEDNINNVIAPFWLDLDLLDANDPLDSGSGSLLIDTIIYEGDTYLVIEWNEVSEFFLGEEDPEIYTFQVVIRENSDDIRFNYLAIPSMPSATIGAENSDATLGVIYFNGFEGTPLPTPIDGDEFSLQLNSQPAGIADIHYEIALSNVLVELQPDSATTQEDVEVVIDVLANDTEDIDFILDASLVAQDSILQTKRLLVLPSTSLDTSTLIVVEAPTNGVISFSNGYATYSPNANYNGTDSFTYSVATADGEWIEAETVSVTITAVNDPPTLNDIASRSYIVGQKVTITAVGNDIDGDTLTYIWNQTNGTDVSFTETEDSISFTAPDVNQSETLSFNVVASDSMAKTAPVTVEISVTPKEKSSGGSLSYLFLLFLLALIVSARVRKHCSVATRK